MRCHDCGACVWKEWGGCRTRAVFCFFLEIGLGRLRGSMAVLASIAMDCRHV